MKGVAIVTGAGTGIGRAAARALADQGWAVALAGRREAPLRETAEGMAAEAVLVRPTDVTDPAEVNALFDAAVARWGRLDFLFNNAGINAPPVPMDELDPVLWREVVDVNLSGMFYCMQAAFRVMKAQEPKGGRIVNNGSISAHVPRPLSAPYAATKHGVTGLTRAGSLDGRAHGIAVGQIDVGNAATEMTVRMAEGVLQPDGSLRPEARMDVADVGRAVAYMASLPAEANVLTMTIMANGMPYVGRG